MVMKNVNLGDMNQREKEIMKNGEFGQGEGLVDAKMRKESSNKVPVSKDRSYSKGSSSSKNSPQLVCTVLFSSKNDFHGPATGICYF